jgi:hypothetical protein
MSKTQEMIDHIAKNSPIRLSEMRKRFKIPPSAIRSHLVPAVKKGWVLECELTRGEGQTQDVEYRIGTAYCPKLAAKAEQASKDEVPTFGKDSRMTLPDSVAHKASSGLSEPETNEAIERIGKASGHFLAGVVVQAFSEKEETAPNIHEEHARELIEALNRIHQLEGELMEAKLPGNWDQAAMIQQLQFLLADGVEIVIGPTRLHILDGDARYEVSKPDELIQTIESIQFLKQRKVA